MSFSQPRPSVSQDTLQDSITLSMESPPISPKSSPVTQRVHKHLHRTSNPTIEPRTSSLTKDQEKQQQHKREFSNASSFSQESLNFSKSSLTKEGCAPPFIMASTPLAPLEQYSGGRGRIAMGERPVRVRLGVTPPRVANPASFGLLAFGVAAICFGLINIRVGGLSSNAPTSLSVIIALFYGGIGQVISGFLEFKNGNTFGGTAFLSYGIYWTSYALHLIPFFNPSPGSTPTAESANDLRIETGLLSLVWTLYSFLLWSVTLRSNLASSLLFFFLGFGFLLSTIANLATGLSEDGMDRVTQAGGVVSIMTGLVSWYCAMAQLSRKTGGQCKGKEVGAHGNTSNMDIEADARWEEEQAEFEAEERRWERMWQEKREQEEVNSFYELPLGAFKK
ncbi:hypothetical protein BGZ83_004136 [Gryganskiella cystojenkinii]|nr:hypothetical protein BGZ83_004136 [Gryganskiella cystojenkinii]